VIRHRKVPGAAVSDRGLFCSRVAAARSRGLSFLAAATLGLGLAAVPCAAQQAEVLPSSGPLTATTMQRLLLTDAARIGNRIVAVGDRGYVVYSDDNGTSWKRAKAPAAPLLTAVRFVDGKLGWAVGHDAVILATSDGGENWTQQFSAASEQRPLLDVMFLDAANGIAVGAYGAYYETSDGGKSWNARKVLADDKHLNGVVKLADGKLVILGEAGTILASADAGKTWAPVVSPYKGSLFGGVVAEDGAVVAYGMRGRIYRSADAGKSWVQVDNASTASLMGGSTLPGGTIVLAGSAGAVLVSRDGGKSFVPLDSGTTRAFSKAVLGAANSILLLGEAGARSVPMPSAPKRSAP
jgi:photosystem II stability/assembly factor-like uncharacterized protein